MASNLLSRRDLDFLLFEWLRVEELTTRDRFAEHSRETFSALLDLCEDLAARYFAPHNKKNDAHEPTFDGERVSVIPEVKQALDAFAKADLLAMSMDHALGGWQLPTVVAGAGLAWFHAANVSDGRVRVAESRQRESRVQLRDGRADRAVRQARRWPAGSPAPCVCRSRRRDRRWPTSPPAPNPRTTAAIACSAPRCGSPAEITNWPRTSCIWCWPRSPVHRAGTRGISLFIVPKFLVGDDGSCRRTQRCRAGRPQPQDGLPRNNQYRTEFR